MKSLAVLIAVSSFLCASPAHAISALFFATGKLTCTGPNDAQTKLTKESFNTDEFVATVLQITPEMAHEFYSLGYTSNGLMEVVLRCNGQVIQQVSAEEVCTSVGSSKPFDQKSACSAKIDDWGGFVAQGHLFCSYSRKIDTAFHMKGSCQGEVGFADFPCTLNVKFSKPFVASGACP